MASKPDPRAQLEHSAASLSGALTVIKAHAQFLARRSWDLSDADRAYLTERLAIIDSQVGRAANLLSDMLHAASADGKPIDPDRD